MWDKAEEAFQKAAETNPGESKVHYNLAMMYNVVGKHQQALSAIERALELKPEDKYISALAQLRRDAEDADALHRQSGEKAQ